MNQSKNWTEKPMSTDEAYKAVSWNVSSPSSLAIESGVRVVVVVVVVVVMVSGGDVVVVVVVVTVVRWCVFAVFYCRAIYLFLTLCGILSGTGFAHHCQLS